MTMPARHRRKRDFIEEIEEEIREEIKATEPVVLMEPVVIKPSMVEGWKPSLSEAELDRIKADAKEAYLRTYRQHVQTIKRRRRAAAMLLLSG